MFPESKALIEALEKRPELVNGLHKLSLLKPIALKKKWIEVSQEMKAAGYRVKSLKEVRKKWSDMKYRVRKKAMEVERNLTITEKSDGVAYTFLSPLEKRVLALLGARKGKTENVEESPSSIALMLHTSTCTISNEDEMIMPTIESIKTVPKVEIVSDAEESASNCSIDVGDSYDQPKINGKGDASSFQEGKRKTKLDSQDYFAELLTLEKEKIQLMKQHNNLLSDTLNELKNLCHVIRKKNL